MNYQDPQLASALAQRYVLGTLRGRARDRFEKLLPGDFQLQRAVALWRERLTGLYADLDPVEPDAKVWEAIARQTGIAPSRPNSGLLTALAASVLAAVTLAVLYFNVKPPAEPATYMAILDDGQEAPAVGVQVLENGAQLRVKTLTDSKPPPDRIYELWMLPADGSDPVSLGVLAASDVQTVVLDARQQSVLSVASALAVSIEPIGGSPVGVPTGDVVFVGALVES